MHRNRILAYLPNRTIEQQLTIAEHQLAWLDRLFFWRLIDMTERLESAQELVKGLPVYREGEQWS